MRAVRLRTEYLVDPLAINTTRPRFSWEIDDPRPGSFTKAYEIKVTSGGKVVWATGKTESNGMQSQIEYSGEALTSQQACEWSLRLWDGNDEPSGWSKGTFRIGKLNPSDWLAKWVTTPEPEPEIVPPHNGYHSVLEKSADVEKWVQLDLGSTLRFDRVTLWPANPFDWQPQTPGFLFPSRFKIIGADEPTFRAPTTIVEYTDRDYDNPKDRPVQFEVPGAHARYVRLVVTKLRQRDAEHFGFALAELELSTADGNVAKGAKVTAKDSVENRNWGVNQLVNGDKHGHGWKGLDALPVTTLAKTFRLSKKVRSAVLYGTALGAYHATVNGKEVGPNILAPEWTDYHTRVQYQVYDVTKLLKTGDNMIQTLLGDGWYAGRIGMSQGLDPRGYPRAVYGRRAWFLGQMEIEFEDGSRQTITTDESWKSTTEGALRTSDIYDGEHWDWNKQVETPPDQWASVRVSAEVPGGREPKLVAQSNEPIRVVEKLKPLSVTEPKPGVYVVDMGQNMVGRIRANVVSKDGKTLAFQYAEMLNEDGTVYTANLRGAPQRDTFTMRDGKPGADVPVGFSTLFTYHGFRYVEITGATKRPKVSDIVGEVFCSSSPETAKFECSDPMVNKLWSNIFWTQRANLMSSPTDCPQRDERLGWMGDILAFAQNSYYNMDMAGFFTKWLVDVRDAQADDGRYPDFAPHPYGKNDRFTGVPGWGDAGVVCAWVHYENTGDVRLLTEHFESAKRWVDWIASKNPDHLWRNNRHNDYGDWLNGDTLVQDGWDSKGSELRKDIFATMMWYQSALMVDWMASAIAAAEPGKSGDVLDLIKSLTSDSKASKYESMAEAIRTAFVKEYVQPDGGIIGDTQAGYALALYLGMAPEELRPKMLDKLVAAIERRGGVLTTGFHSTLPMMTVLRDWGRGDLAYKLLLNKQFPSWGYTIENGATTIWERWDGYVKGRGFQDPGMNSFNHWALGSVGQWIMETLGGIRPMTPGWVEFWVAPVPGPGVDWAKAEYRSPYGWIKSSWRRKGKQVVVQVTVPPNSSGTFETPSGYRLVSNDRKLELSKDGRLDLAPGVTSIVIESN